MDIDLSLDDIIKLNKKKKVQAPNKLKEFRGRVGKKKVQGVSPLNRLQGSQNAGQKQRRNNFKTKFSGGVQQYAQGNVRNLRNKTQSLSQAKRSLQAAKRTLQQVEMQLNSKINRDATFNRRRNLPVQQVTQTTQRRKLNRNFSSRQTGYMRSDQKQWSSAVQTSKIMSVSISNSGAQSTDVQVKLPKNANRRFSQQSQRGQQQQRGGGVTSRRGQRGRSQRGRGVGTQRVNMNQQQRQNAKIQRSPKIAKAKTQRRNNYQGNQVQLYNVKTVVPLSDRFSQINPPRRGRGSRRGGRGGRGGQGRANYSERQVFL